MVRKPPEWAGSSFYVIVCSCLSVPGRGAFRPLRLFTENINKTSVNHNPGNIIIIVINNNINSFYNANLNIINQRLCAAAQCTAYMMVVDIIIILHLSDSNQLLAQYSKCIRSDTTVVLRSIFLNSTALCAWAFFFNFLSPTFLRS